MREAAENVRVGEELCDCPRCGAERGFHVSFVRKGQALSVIVVCPSCGFRFAVGEWTVPTGEARPFDPAIDAGP